MVALAVAAGVARTGSARAAAAPLSPQPAPGVAAVPAAPVDFVTDGAGFLSPAARDELDRRLDAYQRATGHQVLLWIGQTTGGEPIEGWAVRAFGAWRVGRKGIDDGVVLFVMAADRKVRIEVGYGLEDRLTDAAAARIIGDEMVPRLRAGDRDGAARAGVSGVLAALGGEVGAVGAPPAAEPVAGVRPQLGVGTIVLLVIVGLVVLGFLITHPRLALMLLTTIASSGGRRGGWGGGSGGGGWRGGGFGGGGFSGGGGRSGGGGASGSW